MEIPENVKVVIGAHSTNEFHYPEPEFCVVQDAKHLCEEVLRLQTICVNNALRQIVVEFPDDFVEWGPAECVDGINSRYLDLVVGVGVFYLQTPTYSDEYRVETMTMGSAVLFHKVAKAKAGEVVYLGDAKVLKKFYRSKK